MLQIFLYAISWSSWVLHSETYEIFTFLFFYCNHLLLISFLDNGTSWISDFFAFFLLRCFNILYCISISCFSLKIAYLKIVLMFSLAISSFWEDPTYLTDEKLGSGNVQVYLRIWTSWGLRSFCYAKLYTTELHFSTYFKQSSFLLGEVCLRNIDRMLV